jgi:hypothetical protein
VNFVVAALLDASARRAATDRPVMFRDFQNNLSISGKSVDASFIVLEPK